MGTCYSRQGQLHTKDSLPLTTAYHTDAMPHMMKGSEGPSEDQALADRHTSNFGFRKPPSRHHSNSNEQSNRDSDRTTLGTITNTNKSKNNGSGRFGFKGMGRKDKSKKGQLPTSPSSDSVQSARSHEDTTQVKRPGRSGSLPSSRQSSLRKAYIPRSNTGSWRMIDDSSSVYSGTSARPSDRVCPSDSTTPAPSTDDVNNANSSASTPVKSAATILLKAPIAAMESLETLSSGDDPKSRGAPRPTQQTCLTAYGNQGNAEKLQSRLRGPFKKSNRPNSGVPTAKTGPESNGQKQAAPDPTQAKAKGSKNGGGSFLKKGFLRKQKPANDTVSKAAEPVTGTAKDVASTPETVINQPVGTDRPAKEAQTQALSQSQGQIAESADNTRSPNSHIEETSKPVIEEVTLCQSEAEVENVPDSTRETSAHDVTDAASVHSTQSQDLTLDKELYDLNTASALLDKSYQGGRSRTRSRSGSRSRSYERPGDDSCHRVEKKDGRLSGLKHEATSEPLDELASLVEASSGTAAQRRQQRLQRAPRPVSFPGPRSRGSSVTENGTEPPAPHGGSLSLKPPRQGSLHADDEQISIDGFTYRHLVQDVTTFKTMLLKLKRLIQEEEFQGQTWKNGFKLSSSQPTSPYDDTNKFNFASLLDTEEGIPNPGCLDDVMKENQELKQQNMSLQHQLEEQERTIKLLQQQMTKYECGYSEPGGKAYTHACTQTDRQTSGFYKSTGSYRTACVRRTSSSSSHQGAPRYRTEFRASRQSTNSVTPQTDEVFLETMSCDNDDDLDLLMEEVSLGSDLGSIGGDSHYGGSFRGSSVTSFVLPPEGRESSLSRLSRDHSLSHNEGQLSSQMYRDHSLSRSVDTSGYRRCDSLEQSKDICHGNQSPASVSVHDLQSNGQHTENTNRSGTQVSTPDKPSSENTNSNNRSGTQVSTPDKPSSENTNSNNRSSSQVSTPDEPNSVLSDNFVQSSQQRSDENISMIGNPGNISQRHSPDGSTSRSAHMPSGMSCHSPEGGSSPPKQGDCGNSSIQCDDFRSDGESGFGTGEPNEMLAIRESLAYDLNPDSAQQGTGPLSEQTESEAGLPSRSGCENSRHKHMLTKQDHVTGDVRDPEEQTATDLSGSPDKTPPGGQKVASDKLSPTRTSDQSEPAVPGVPGKRTLKKYHTPPTTSWLQGNQSSTASYREGSALSSHHARVAKAPYRAASHKASQDRGYLRPPGKKTSPSKADRTSPIKTDNVSSDSQTVAAAKRRRQLPTLTSVTRTDTRSSGVSRLPKAPSTGNLRITTTQPSANNTRGRPYVK